MRELNAIESAVLGKLLEGELPVLASLRGQLPLLRVTRRELTGVGFFTEFALPGGLALAASPRRVAFGDVLADMDGLEHGAGFVLFVEDGVIAMLEGYTTANETWPKSIERFALRYWPPERDLSPLQTVVAEPAT
jgi:hypothetical protein